MSEAETSPSFGRYRDAVMLGAGGMGAVYRAVDPSLDRYVAIKVLTQREPKYVERFRREAQVLAKIMHPSIIQIYEIVGSDEDESDPYIVMEYFEGKPLDALLKQRKTLPAFEVVNILHQTAEGLKKAHANNVIHRDIKPANIMVSEIGDVKILDFGIAKLRDAKKDLTGNTVLGTPFYMSPEQAMGQPIDARTDIYSLGITAFHLLTGKRPFEAKSKVDVMLAQVKTPLPSILQFAPCDERVVAIVEKMCAKKQVDRHQSCDELIEALDALPKSLGGRAKETQITKPDMPKVAPKPVTPPAATRPRMPSKPTSRPSSRNDVRKPAAASWWKGKLLGANRLVVIGAGAGVVVVLIAILLAAVFRGGKGAGSSAWRVPSKGWISPGPPAPSLKLVQQNGAYGNCVFSSKTLERGKEDEGAVRSTFSYTEPIYGRCYFARQIGPNKPGEVWQELWVDGQKRAQIIYDPALPNDEDQLALEVSRRHGTRIGELSNGKHTLDIWIYRQADDAENPEPLAAGELIVRK
ncbi:MAG: serine/threonine protein kinase [Myxococcales bacterium]|nr:serine/threonine protein kinase [Myxococcales bacterium]